MKIRIETLIIWVVVLIALGGGTLIVKGCRAGFAEVRQQRAEFFQVLDILEVGMDRVYVEQALGQPVRKDISKTEDGELAFYIYVAPTACGCPNDTDKIEIDFINNKIASIKYRKRN